MTKNILDYHAPVSFRGSRSYVIGIWLGRTSICFLALMPLTYFIWMLGILLLIPICVTALPGVVLSRGRSICSWLGVAVVGYYASILIWMLVTGG